MKQQATWLSPIGGKCRNCQTIQTQSVSCSSRTAAFVQAEEHVPRLKTEYDRLERQGSRTYLIYHHTCRQKQPALQETWVIICYLPVNCLYPLRILDFHHLARFAAMWLPLHEDSCTVRRYTRTQLSNNPGDTGNLPIRCVIHDTLHLMTTQSQLKFL
jgi:hypothetical protein